jgi:ATP-dependent Lon protease
MTPDDAQVSTAPATSKPLPADAMIVLPVRDVVLFPQIVMPIAIGRPASIEAVQQAAREQRQIVVVLQRDTEVAEPKAGDLYGTGTLANILRYIKAPDGTHHIVCQGVQRFRITEYLDGYPFPVARGLHVCRPSAPTGQIE